MKILVTGAKGFVGRNLCANLYNIKEGKDRTRSNIQIEEVFEFDIDTDIVLLDDYCEKADFVFNLAGVNRPKEQSEFMEGNFGFASTLLDTLEKHGNKCPVMLSSSQQASLTGRFGNSEYGRSKKAGEDLFLKYGEENGVKVLVYRFPNLFGKWCRPNYNSAVATFCHNIANDLPIQVNDPSVELELLYIDDLIEEMFDALEGKEHHCEFNGLEVIPAANGQQPTANGLQTPANGLQLSANGQRLTANGQQPTANGLQLSANGQRLTANGKYCYCPVTHKVTLGEIVELLHTFKELPNSLTIPEIPSNSFAKKLFSTYLSYLPKEKAIFDLKMNVDARGSFTELVHTLNCGQVSINISKPGITKGQHWHNSKWEQFIVVKGHGLIQLRKEGCNENIFPSIRRGAEGGVVTQTSRRSRYNENDDILEFEVSGDKIQSVIMLPGYTHNIINLSDTEDLVTVMYCNEIFNPDKPDTFFDPVE